MATEKQLVRAAVMEMQRGVPVRYSWGKPNSFVRECKMRNRRWSRYLVIEEIKRLKATGVNLRHGGASKSHSSLVSAGVRYYGSWGNAVTAAGFDYGRIKTDSQAESSARRAKWTIDRISRQIQELAAAGEPLSAGAVRRNHSALFSAATSPRHFGSWRKAVTAQGFNYDVILGRATRSTIPASQARASRLLLRRLIVLADDVNGLPPEQVRTRYPRLYEAATDQFGSWEAAVQAASRPRRS